MAMSVSDKILVDTSVWIDFFRGKEPARTTALRLMEENRVCCAGIILAELLQGAKSPKELQVLRDFIHVFPFLSESTSIWEQAGDLSYRLRRQGKTVGLADCFLAILATENSTPILTLDEHFVALSSEIKLVLEPIN